MENQKLSQISIKHIEEHRIKLNKTAEGQHCQTGGITNTTDMTWGYLGFL